MAPSKPDLGLLTAFAKSPGGIRFETQAEEEVIILFLRQHLIVLLPNVLILLLMILAPALLIPLTMRISSILPFPLPGGYFIVGTLFWYLAVFGFALGSFIHWFFNIYIVTNKRIVDIDFVNLLYKAFSEANISKIEDITFTARGLSETVFNYGDVFIETAGENPNIEFYSVPQPDKIVQTISELLK